MYKELKNHDIPGDVKFAVESKVFSYLDEIGLQYVKAETSVINHNGASIPIIISFPNHTKNVRLSIPEYEIFDDIWIRLEKILPDAIIYAIKKAIINTFNLGIDINHLRKARVIPGTPGFGPDNLRDYTILFKDFASKITEIPKSITADYVYNSNSMLRHYSISSYFYLVYKSQHGITPILTNQMVNIVGVKEELESPIASPKDNKMDYLYGDEDSELESDLDELDPEDTFMNSISIGSNNDYSYLEGKRKNKKRKQRFNR